MLTSTLECTQNAILLTVQHRTASLAEDNRKFEHFSCTKQLFVRFSVAYARVVIHQMTVSNKSFSMLLRLLDMQHHIGLTFGQREGAWDPRWRRNAGRES